MEITTITEREFKDALSVLANRGNSGALADVYSQATDETRVLVEPALLRGIEVCERSGWVGPVTGLLVRTGLSDAVRDAAQRVVDTKTAITPFEIVIKYLIQERNPLAGGGTLSNGRTPAPKAGTAAGTGRAQQMRVRT